MILYTIFPILFHNQIKYLNKKFINNKCISIIHNKLPFFDTSAKIEITKWNK